MNVHSDFAVPPNASGIDPNQVGARVRASLQSVEHRASRLGRINSIMNIAGILASGLTTAFTGWTSLAGPVFGDSTAAWRLSCILAAVMGFAATSLMGINQQLRFGDRLSRANECLGRLKSLDFSLVTGAQNPREVWTEYAAILRQFPEELR